MWVIFMWVYIGLNIFVKRVDALIFRPICNVLNSLSGVRLGLIARFAQSMIILFYKYSSHAKSCKLDAFKYCI